jgi:hypothetical protein
MQPRPTGRLGRRCTARAAVRMRDQSSWDERAMIRFVPRGLGAQDRLSTTPCAAPTLGQFAPAARVRERAGARRLGAVRERGTSARWLASYGSAFEVYDAAAVVEIGFRRPLTHNVQPPAQRLSSWARGRRGADQGSLAGSERLIRAKRARNAHGRRSVMY